MNEATPTSDALSDALSAALTRLLRPLMRLMLRHAVPFKAFEELAKRAYVDAATHDFALPGKKPSISRASILTGLTRKDVQRLMETPDAPRPLNDKRYNRAARVLTGWVRDADFQTAEGQARTLQIDGDQGFAALVKRHGGDVPARAVLDELLRVGAVAQGQDGGLTPVARAYVPQQGEAEKLDILGTDVAGLIDTIDHNLQHGATDPRFQRKVAYRSIAIARLPEFRQLSATRSQALLEQLDQWLAERDDVGPADPHIPTAEIGLGIYYMEARSVGAPTQGSPA
ncbi:MAG: hypothetical protein RLZZ618_2131 [Pseudomonadota bacterium]|jgi:hypothetical protein